MTFAARTTSKPTVEKRRTCTNCGRLGHLVTTCTNPERYHDKIGIEIEGWFHDLGAARRKAAELTGREGNEDGSIRHVSNCTGDDNTDAYDDDPEDEDCEEGCDNCPHPVARTVGARCAAGKTNCKSCGARGWEFQTKPGSVGEALRQLTQLYPDVTSRAAGMHVHMSFKEPTSITMLCSDAFFKYWQERWEKWGTKNNVQGAFWERLRNENQYCRPSSMAEDYDPKDIVTKNKHGRYKAINFQAWDEWKTVEFRLLPMFQKGNLAVSAVEQLVDIVESYLQKAVIDTDVVSPKIKTPATPDAPIEMEPIVMDFEVPVREYPSITGEVDLDVNCQMGPVFDEQGNPTGKIRMFRYQLDAYYTNLAADAVDKKARIADPKKFKVKWESFDPNPTALNR